MGVLVGDDDHVGSAETIVHILGCVHALFYDDDGVDAGATGILDLGNHKGHILVNSFHKLIRVEI